MSKQITKEDLITDFKKLGVKRGDFLNVKCSLKSIGYVIGGARTLIDALLAVVGSEGTIVTDSFVRVYRKNIAQKKPIIDDKTPSYAGALANAMIKYPSSFRSKHPVQKFSAIGYMVREVTENHTPKSYAYDVLKYMCKNGGKNLKIGSDKKVVGVGTTHVAIGILGFKQLRPICGVYYLNKDGQKEFFERNWAGICSNGLIKFIPYYEKAGAIISKGTVGNAEAKITDMKKTLEVELKILKEDPTFFMCNQEDCLGCQLTWEFSKGNKWELLFKYLIKGNMRQFIRLSRAMIIMKAEYHEYGGMLVDK